MTRYRQLKYPLSGIQFTSFSDEATLIRLYSVLTMYNAVSCNIALASTQYKPKDTKLTYAIDFSMAVSIIRMYFRMKTHSPPQVVLDDIKTYVEAVREGRHDTRHMKPKSVVWFVYRVAA